MRALVFEDVRRVALATVPEPRLEEPGDVVVAVELAGLCGSDLHVWHGRERGLDAGTVMGHEYVGRVIEAGSAVRRLRPGQRVAGPFSTSCGDCYYCRRQLPARCARGQLFGWVADGRGLHGAQAERLRVPLADSTLEPVPDGCSPEAALFAGDVLATGFFGVELAGVTAGDVVAVVGCGPVGLCAVVAATAGGAARVLAIDRVAERLALAARFGGEPVELDGAAQAVAEATEGRGVDAVLECVGSTAATRLAVDLSRPGATVAALGVHTEERFAFAPGEAYDRNLTYAAGRCPARRFLAPLLRGLAEGRWDPTPIVSHRLPLADGPEAYQLFAERRDGCTKVVFHTTADR